MASNGTPLRHTHGQLPHATVRAEQRQTDALLSAGKMLHPCTHTQKNTHTHMHTHSVLCSSPSILHLSAPCCQRARQEVMFVPSGTVIFSFSPLLTHVSFLLLFSPLLSFPLHFCVAFTVKKNATGLEIQPVRDRSGLWSGLYICESVCGESPGMNMTRALCQRGYSSNCSNANDHI